MDFILDIIVIAAMAASALILYRKTLGGKVSRLVEGLEGLVREGWDGERRPILLVAEGEPKGGSLGKRLYRLASRSPLPVSYVYTYYPVDKSYVASVLEEELRRLDFKLSASRLERYRVLMRSLEEMYKDVMESNRPVATKLSAVLWTGPGDEPHVLSFKRMLEAETGVRFRVVKDAPLTSIAEIGLDDLKVRIEPEGYTPRKGEVVVGVDMDSGDVVTFSWPNDFETHMFVVGPTGMGKTVLLSGMAVQLSLYGESGRGPASTIIIDPKGDLASLLEGVASRVLRPRSVSELPKPPAASPPLHRLVVYSLEFMSESDRSHASKRILSSLVDYALSGDTVGSIVSIVDEAWRVSGSVEVLERIVREGRSRGLYVLFASQSHDDLPPSISDNVGVIAAFGGQTEGYAEGVANLGVSRTLLVRAMLEGVGVAVVRGRGGGSRMVRILPFNEYLKKARESLG